MIFIYPRSVYGALRLVEQINVRNKWKKKNSNWYEAKQLFTSFTKEMILSLPKLLSLTDLYESFVMWLTVQELLLGIVVYLSLVKSK